MPPVLPKPSAPHAIGPGPCGEAEHAEDDDFVYRLFRRKDINVIVSVLRRAERRVDGRLLLGGPQQMLADVGLHTGQTAIKKLWLLAKWRFFVCAHSAAQAVRRPIF